MIALFKINCNGNWISIDDWQPYNSSSAKFKEALKNDGVFVDKIRLEYKQISEVGKIKCETIEIDGSTESFVINPDFDKNSFADNYLFFSINEKIGNVGYKLHYKSTRFLADDKLIAIYYK